MFGNIKLVFQNLVLLWNKYMLPITEWVELRYHRRHAHIIYELTYALIVDRQKFNNTRSEICKIRSYYIFLGKKIVIRGQFDAAYCDADRYQPIKYFTNVSGECLFQKSTCFGEGQIIHTDKNPVEDLTCRCDHAKGYTFTTPPKNQCFCVPSVEDCSCYRKICNSSTIGLSQGNYSVN